MNTDEEPRTAKVLKRVDEWIVEFYRAIGATEVLTGVVVPGWRSAAGRAPWQGHRGRAGLMQRLAGASDLG